MGCFSSFKRRTDRFSQSFGPPGGSPQSKIFPASLHGSSFFSKTTFWFQTKFLPIIYPRRCPVCQKLLPCGQQICPGCRRILPKITGPVCFSCGKPVSFPEQEFCYDCRLFKKSFKKGRALFLYNEIIHPSIMDFKYHNHRLLSGFFTDEIVKSHGFELLTWNIQAVIPVPVHKNKRKKRGYNQAALLAKDLGFRLHLPCISDLLLRTIDTPPQKAFSPQARLKNIQNAFCLNPAYQSLLPTLHTVLLIDDIYTTGATMEACTRVMRVQGIQNVYIYSLCIGIARD